jgi:hypothetical protein
VTIRSQAMPAGASFCRLARNEKTPPERGFPSVLVMEDDGIEPTTSALQRRRSPS